MAKTGGSTKLKQGSYRWKAQAKEYYERIGTGKYTNSYLSEIGGGFYLEEKSTLPRGADELFVATVLADKGKRVILQDEAGQAKTTDGEIISIGFYEQRTPTWTEEKKAKATDLDRIKNIRSCLYHARDKKADIAVIYMKNNLHNLTSVKEGIKAFEKKSKYEFKSIIIVTSDGRIHTHKHNKKGDIKSP